MAMMGEWWETIRPHGASQTLNYKVRNRPGHTHACAGIFNCQFGRRGTKGSIIWGACIRLVYKSAAIGTQSVAQDYARKSIRSGRRVPRSRKGFGSKTGPVQAREFGSKIADSTCDRGWEVGIGSKMSGTSVLMVWAERMKERIYILWTKSPKRFRYADSFEGFAMSTCSLFVAEFDLNSVFPERERKLLSPTVNDTAVLCASASLLLELGE